MDEKSFAIFIPAYEHTKTLPSVLNRIPKKIKKKAQEIIVIDDASSDNTYLLAIGYRIVKKLRNLTIIRNKKNKGYGGNQKIGYNYAIKKGYDLVVMLHGDGQYKPELLPKLLKPFDKDNVDVVFGSRMTGKPLKGGMPLYKYIGNKVLTAIENFVLGMNLSEFHSGYRIYSCDALKRIPFNKNSNDFHFDTEILIQAHEANLRIVEIPIPTYYGDEISYVNVFKYGIDIFKSLLEYKLYKKGIIKSTKFDIKKKKQVIKK